jgi:hypothetical protein
MAEVARDYETDGVPSSGSHKIKKGDLRNWGAWVEGLISAFTANGGLIYASKASLDADLAHGANSMAWVIGDATVDNNGVYRKIGASGVGSWTRVADLPFSFIIASDVGAGTANAIQATTSIPVSGSALIWMNIFEANTASPVTVSFNGGSALTIKTNSGNDVAVGGLTAGMIVMGIVSGSTFRLVSDQASSAVLAACEAAQAAAEAAAAAAQGARPAATRTDLKAFNTALTKAAILMEGTPSTQGRMGLFILKEGDFSAAVASDPQEGVYIKADDSLASVRAWVRVYTGPLVVTWFGASTSNTAAANDTAINAAFAMARSQTNAQRRAVRIPAGNYTVQKLLIEHDALQFALSGDGEFATVLWRPTSVASELLRVKGEGVSVTDLTIQQATYVSGDSSIGVLVKKDYGTLIEGAMPTADSDFSMSRVRVTGFNTGVEHWGRGWNTDGCSLSLCGWGAVYQWPNEGDYTEGSQPVQLDETGFRYFQHANIRGHSNLFGLFRNDGPNAHKINGIQVNGVSMDIGRRLWQGVLRQGIISDFAVTQTPTPAFTLTDGSEDYIIAAGTIQGDTIAERVPVYCIELTGDHSSGSFRDILMKQCTSHGVYHDGSGVATDMVLDGLDFVDVCTTTAGANPIRFNGASHTVFVDNITLDVASALTGVVRGTSSSATIRVGRVRSLRAFTRPLDSSNSGCLMDVARYFSGPSTTGNYDEFYAQDGSLKGRIAQSTSGLRIVVNDTSNIWIGFGSGTPESFEAAGIGSVYWDVTNGVQYNKKSGANSNTGWKLVTQAV